MFSIVFLLMLSLSSCKKKDDPDAPVVPANDEVSVFFNTEIANLEDAEDALDERNFSESSSKTTTELDDDFLLHAKFIPSEDNLPSSDLRDINGLAAPSTPLAKGTWYRVLVFDTKTGKLNSEIKYQRGRESSADSLKLKKNTEYTFIAYSVNTLNEDDLPNVLGGLSDKDKSISELYIEVTNKEDLLFYKSNVTLSSEDTQQLLIPFEHQFTQITVLIDATLTGYNITRAKGNLTTPTSTSQLNFSDGSINRLGNSLSTNLVFPSLINSFKTSSEPVIISADNINKNNFIRMTDLTIGPLSATNKTFPVSVSKLEGGKKYTLKVTITPKDKYFKSGNNEVALINGDVWMRVNHGGSQSNPDNPRAAIYGNYYQWGRNFIMASGDSPATSKPANWIGDPTITSIYAWDGSGPCPTGFRVPTKVDFRDLINATTWEVVGTDNSSSRAGIMISKRNKNVQLTFPAVGFYSVAGNSSGTNFTWPVSSGSPIVGKGSNITVWTSDRDDISRVFIFKIVNSNNRGPVMTYPGTEDGSNNANALLSIPVRCVQ